MQIITDPAGKELKKHGDSSFPFLVSYERLSGSFLWHWHPEIELTYIKKGEMLYKINQNTFHLKEGQAIFGNANALHAGYMYQDQDCQYIPITFDPKLIYGFSGSLLFQKYTEPILRSFSLSAVNPSCSITESGLLSGFSDSNYYTKVFTKIKGCTPRQYRKNQEL